MVTYFISDIHTFATFIHQGGTISKIVIDQMVEFKRLYTVSTNDLWIGILYLIVVN